MQLQHGTHIAAPEVKEDGLGAARPAVQRVPLPVRWGGVCWQLAVCPRSNEAAGVPAGCAPGGLRTKGICWRAWEVALVCQRAAADLQLQLIALLQRCCQGTGLHVVVLGDGIQVAAN